MLLTPVSWRCQKASGMAESSGQGVCKRLQCQGLLTTVCTASDLQEDVAATSHKLHHLCTELNLFADSSVH